MAVVVAVMVASTAGGAATARADAPPAGALSQLPGQAACLATTNSDAPPDAGCTLLRTSATSGSCINGLGNAAISPDGLDLYLVDQGSNTLVHMRRDPATGQIAQALGTGGCISGSGRNGCARARGIANGKRRKKGQPGLPTLRGVAISPDGRNVYVSAAVAPTPSWPSAATPRPARCGSSPGGRAASASASAPARRPAPCSSTTACSSVPRAPTSTSR